MASQVTQNCLKHSPTSVPGTTGSSPAGSAVRCTATRSCALSNHYQHATPAYEPNETASHTSRQDEIDVDELLTLDQREVGSQTDEHYHSLQDLLSSAQRMAGQHDDTNVTTSRTTPRPFISMGEAPSGAITGVDADADAVGGADTHEQQDAEYAPQAIRHQSSNESQDHASSGLAASTSLIQDSLANHVDRTNTRIIARRTLLDEMEIDAARRSADDQDDDSDGFDSDSQERAASNAPLSVSRILEFGPALQPPEYLEESSVIEQADNIIQVRNLSLQLSRRLITITPALSSQTQRKFSYS